METFFFFKKLISAICCLMVFFQRRRSRIVLLRKIRSKFCAEKLYGIFGVLTLLLATTSSALGAEKFCSDAPYFGVIDGNIRPAPTQITIDCDCTFQNFPQSKPLTTTVNFQTNDSTIYLIIYDNIYFTGHMACANVDHRIWFSNSSDYGSSNACQDLFIPVETIDKEKPAGQTTAAIGVPFTYTLTVPAMSLGGGPSTNDLHSVTIWDDLTATGADLTYVDINAYYKATGAPVPLVPETDPLAPGGVWTAKNLSYKKIPLILAGEQIVLEITVVLDDTARNVAGTQFTNTAKWRFGRLIDGTYYEPLPGEWGEADPMTIVEPDLVFTKTGPPSVINLGQWAEFTIDVRNSGTWSGDAWNVNIVDRLPSEPSHSFNGGMCDMTPEVTGVTLAGRSLTPNTDYLLNYAGCELSLNLLEAAGPIGPNEHLSIAYRTKVDADSESGAVLTNVAAATEWSNDEDDTIGQTYTCSPTDGTVGTSDCQDAHDLLVTLSGYFFEKTVANPNTGELVTSATPGETLRYTLHLRSIDEPFTGLRFYDDLGVLNALPAFEPGSLTLVSYPVGADISHTDPSGGTNSAGILDIRNLSISAGDTIEVKFDITLASTLPEDFVVLNQADLINGTGKIADSDDPNISGQADPSVVGDEDPTQVLVYFPPPLPPTKALVLPATPEAKIGQEVRYEITVPETVSSRPLYDVVVTDALDDNLEYLGFTQISGPAVTDNSVGSDLSFSVAQIPSNQQAVIELRTRVRNVVSAQQGVAIDNAVSYTYANTSGGTTRPPLVSGTVTLHIVEPYIATITKSANETTPTAGEVVRYSVTLPASSGNYLSDVFDVTIIDNLGLGLAYSGNPTVTAGTGVSADNTIGAPVITGDGINQAQTLRWSLSDGNADIDIAEGTPVTVSYDVRVLDGVLANQALTNSVIAQWTGSDGLNDYERNGADGIGGINDYVTAAVASTVTTPDLNAVITKERTSDTYVAGDANVRIGDIVEYELRVSVPEGTLGNLELIDTLPQGLKFEGTVSINGNTGPAPYAAVAPFTHTAIPEASETGDPAVSSTTVTWSLGSVTNQPDDGSSDDFVVVYRARVLNQVFAHTDLSITLNNVVDMTYEKATGSVTDSDNGTVTALQPMLIVSKNSTPVSGSSITGGDTVTYTVDIRNTGNAPAYDVLLQDIVPLGLREGGVTMVSTYLVSSPNPGLANLSPVYDSATGVATWDFDSGVYVIPAGDTLRVVYSVPADADLGEGLTLTNQATVNWYYSFDDDAPPTLGGITGEREIYGPTNTASTTLVTGPLPAKTLLSPATSEATIGQEALYRITVPGSVSANALYDLVITDTLDSNLEYLGFTQISGPAVTDNSVAPDLSFSVAQIPAGQQVVIEVRARMRNIMGAQQGGTIGNSVSYTYANTSGGTTQPALSSGTVRFNVVEPSITTITKSANPTTATAGDTVHYLATLTAGSGTAFSDVFDVTIIDNLGLGLAYAGNPSVTVSSGVGADNTMGAPVVTGDGINQVQRLVWSLSDGNADIDVAEGTSVTVSYDVRVLDNVLAGQTLTNGIVAQWTGIDGENAFERNGTDGIGGLNDYVTTPASTSVNTPVPGVLSKETTQASAAIGEAFTYIIAVPATPVSTRLYDVQIMDNLAASAADLRFVGAEVVAGSSWTGTLVNNGSDTDLVEIASQDINNVIEIPANGQIRVAITVRVLNTSKNRTPGLSFTNRAWYIYSNDTSTLGSDDTTGATSESMTVAHPTMTMAKTGPIPATMQIGTPGSFTLDARNTGTSDAWNVTITDWLPNPTPGGMCNGGVSSISATIYQADGATPVLSLIEDTHYETSFAVSATDPRCEFVLSLKPPAVLAPGQRLIVNYSVELDTDNIDDSVLTNIGGATQWLSADPTGSDYYTYTAELTDGTEGTLDHQDAYSVRAQGAILAAQKTVENLTTNQSGANARPNDRLRYTITINNTTNISLNNFSLVDEIDGLNASPMFQSGSIENVSVPVGADYVINDGTLTINGLSIGGNGTLTLSFEAVLVPVITNGTIVRNQAQLTLLGNLLEKTDDPNVSGEEDPTETLISSAPSFEVQKTSTIMSGDPDVLMAGETLRYTITVKNIGNEDAVNVGLKDYTPANTTYVANSTTLNGNAVSDTSLGVNPLEVGILVNAPEDTTAGNLGADVATVTFDVVVDPNAMNGLIIENQGLVNGSGAGSGIQPEQLSDDPNTPVSDDPTRNIVGNLPLLYAHKTVQILENFDFGSRGIVDPGDVLLYTIVISNSGAVQAGGVVLIDAVPTHTTYVTNSLRLNGEQVGLDGGISPLIAGLSVHSSDNPGAGIISAGESAVITFEAEVNDDVSTETLITNQGSVTCDDLSPQLTDADGVPSNGYQPTVIVVGDMQLLSITKQVVVIGGGPAEAGSELEYVIRVINIGSLSATQVVVTDDLSPLADQVTYLAGSGTLNGSTSGVSYDGVTLTANYATPYGDLLPGASAVLRFHVQINPTVAMGTMLDNTAVVAWSDAQNASATVSLDVGGTPGSASLNGEVWHDANLDKICDSSTETMIDGWSVELYYDNQLVKTVVTDANGVYRLTGLTPNTGMSEFYELRFHAAEAGPNTASMGQADSSQADSSFIDGPQRISGIAVTSGDNLQNLNMPTWPNGAVYDSVARVPIAGARLALLNATTGAALPSQCFDDPIQQNQVTAQDGFYKFDLNFSNASCPAGGPYLIEVSPPAAGYQDMPSQIIPPTSDVSTMPFSIPDCSGRSADAVPATSEYCEVVTSAAVPPPSVLPRSAGTVYHLHLLLSDGSIPGQSQVFNNSIPIDPELDGAVAITKTSPLTNVTRGTLVPYTITVTNVYGSPLYDIRVVDRFPAGFKYVAGSARLNGSPVEPKSNGSELAWDDLELQVNQKHTIKLMLVVGSGVSEEEYVNRAMVLETATGGAVSREATATVRVIPDPTFDCTDVIGKVFDDSNLNGHQDAEEKGLQGVRVVTVRGLIANTDKHGRFHITCAAVPDEDQGSNFILKLDERSLPAGYRITTENPRVQRATRGKMLRFNFGATIHRVVRIDIADGAFEPNQNGLRLQWTSKIPQLLEELKKAPSVLRLSYLGEVERKGLVQERLKALEKKITKQWKQSDGGYRLVIETEIFWRRGSPLAGQ